MNKEFIQRLTEIVEANLANDSFGIEDVVKEMGMSHSNLHRRLKTASNQSISQFIREFTGIEKAIPIILEEKYQTIEDYLAKNAEYPEEDRASFNQGTEVVKFVITPTGDITDIKIVNSVSKKIDEEVRQTLKSTKGMWTPGTNDDKPFAMGKEVSLVFKIEGLSNMDFRALGQTYYLRGSNALISKESPKKALKYLDKGVVLLPNDKALLLLRGLARYEIGNKDGALNDWNRVKDLGGIESEEYIKNFNDLKGYADLTQTLNQ